MPSISRAGTLPIFVMSISLRILRPETAKRMLSRAFLPTTTTLAEAVNSASLLKNFARAAHGSGGGWPPGSCAKETDASNEQPKTVKANRFIGNVLFGERGCYENLAQDQRPIGTFRAFVRGSLAVILRLHRRDASAFSLAFR